MSKGMNKFEEAGLIGCFKEGPKMKKWSPTELKSMATSELYYVVIHYLEKMEWKDASPIIAEALSRLLNLKVAMEEIANDVTSEDL
jgi:hypothetical protein